MFSFVTINVCMNFAIQSISYIDNREFVRNSRTYPGPFEYQLYIYSEPINVIPSVTFYLNNWLADGLLFYRCHVIYGKSYRIMALPFLIYLASLATGSVAIAQIIRPNINLHSTVLFDPIFLSISLALAILLTLMIIVRLFLHGRNLRHATGSFTDASRPYNAIVTMFVESYSLYAVTFVVSLGLAYAGNPLQFTFSPILAVIQVITPYLVILRVANRRAMKINPPTPKNLGSLHFRSQREFARGSGSISDGDSVTLMETDEPAILNAQPPNMWLGKFPFETTHQPFEVASLLPPDRSQPQSGRAVQTDDS